jgi:hypothetical protein
MLLFFLLYYLLRAPIPNGMRHAEYKGELARKRLSERDECDLLINY